MTDTDDTDDGHANTGAGGGADAGSPGGTEALLVASTGGSTGRTAVALALALAARDAGRSVGYMKPTGSRPEGGAGTRDTDPMLARDLLDLDAPGHELEPVVYSPAFARAAIQGQEDAERLHGGVEAAFGSLAAGRDLLVVDGGGLDAGATVGLTDPDVADLLDARVLLVAPYAGPGDLDDVLVAADRFGDRLAGVLFNAVGDAAFDGLASDAVPFLSDRGIRTFGTLPRARGLAGVPVGELAADLGAETLTDGVPTDGAVERVVVGAMSASEAPAALRRTRAAVLVSGGDRPEMVTAALDAPGVAAVLLTGGARPSAAVLDRAETAGVPVLLVEADPTTAVQRLDEGIRSGRALDRRAVERMAELLAEYADVDAILLPDDR